MYEDNGATYQLEDFGVVVGEETYDAVTDLYDHVALPKDFEATVTGKNPDLWSRIYSLETLNELNRRKPSSVPKASDNSYDFSENDWIIVQSLLAMGYSDEICCAVLMHPTWISGNKSGRRRGLDRGWQYVCETVSKAATSRKKVESGVHAFGPDGRFSAQLMARSIIDKFNIVYFRGELYCYVDGYYQPGSSTVEYVTLENRLSYSLKPSHLTDTRTFVREIAMAAPATSEYSSRYLAVENGLIDLDTYDLIPSSPRYFTPGRLPVVYDPDVPKQATQAAREYIQSVVGEENELLIWSQLSMSFSTDSAFIRNPVALILYGKRSTGKSELLRLIADFLGPANVSSVDITSLASEKDYYTWNLVGKRANITHEAPPEINLLNTGRLKLLISGDETEMREIAKKPVAANNFARFWMAINHEIRTKGVDPALYKRMRIIRTEHDFSKDPEEKPGFSRHLSSDPKVRSAMLNLALEALKLLKENGVFPETESTVAAMNVQRESDNSAEEFLVEATEAGEDYYETVDKMYAFYCDYVARNRRGEPVGKKNFRKRLEEIFDDRPELKMELKSKWIPEKHNSQPAWIGRRVIKSTFTVPGANGNGSIKVEAVKS